MNFDCYEIFHWNQRSRKPKRADFGNRRIKVILGTRQHHFRVIFVATLLDTRWSQRSATLTNVLGEGVKRAAKGSNFCFMAGSKHAMKGWLSFRHEWHFGRLWVFDISADYDISQRSVERTNMPKWQKWNCEMSFMPKCRNTVCRYVISTEMSKIAAEMSKLTFSNASLVLGEFSPQTNRNESQLRFLIFFWSLPFRTGDYSEVRK